MNRELVFPRRDVASARRAAVAATAVATVVVATVAAALLAGCVAGPNFSAPSTPVATRYTNAPLSHVGDTLASDTAIDNTEAAQAPWWAIFNSAPLDATIRDALTHNHDLAAARARLASAQELSGATQSLRFPRIDLDSSAGRQKYGAAFLGPTQEPAFTFYSIGADASYAFDFAGGIRRTVEQQQALVESRQYERDAATLAVSGQVALQALGVAAARAEVDSLNAVLEDDRRNVQLVQDAFGAGSATRVDVLNAQSQLANDTTLLPPLQRELSNAEHALAVLIGRTPDTWSTPDFSLTQLALPPRLPLTVPSELAHRRPDIMAAEAQLHAATAAVGIAAANRYPQLTLSASASLQSTLFGDLLEAQSGAGGLTGKLTAPLFNHGALRAREQAARDDMQAALASYQQIVLQAFAQVADALEDLDQDAQLLQAEQSAVATSNDNLQLTRASYAAGNTGVLQVLEAERQNQQARLGLVRSQAQQTRDGVQLLLALGGRLPSEAGH
jgi:NodT family efflux transporter outer membrane factor (OMF) lipoprotein